MTEFQLFSCTRKQFPNSTLVKADRSEKIKERRRKYAVSINVSSFQNLSTNLRTNISSIQSNSRQHTHIPSCVGFSSFQKNGSDTSPCSCLTVNIFFNYTFLRSSFNFRFERNDMSLQTTFTVYDGWAQWHHNMAAILPNMDIGHPRWQISNLSKKVQNRKMSCLRTLGI